MTPGASAVLTVGLLPVARAQRRTRAGDALLQRLTADHHRLSPSMRPGWEVYGPAGAALSVGVFGVGALWAADLVFTTELAAQRAVSRSGRLRRLRGRRMRWRRVRRLRR